MLPMRRNPADCAFFHPRLRANGTGDRFRTLLWKLLGMGPGSIQQGP